MMRNFLYSLFLHLILLAIIFLSFYYRKAPPQPQKQESKIAINFISPTQEIAKLDPLIPEEITREEPPKTTEPIKKIIPEKTQPKKIKEKPKLEKPIQKEKQKERKETKKKQPKVMKEKPRTTPIKKPFDEKKIETLNLLEREKFNIISQIKNCHKRATYQTNSLNNENVTMNITIQKNGYINPKLIIIKDFIKYSDPKEINFKKSVNIANKALELCNPLRNLPMDKYEIWKEVTLHFDGVIK